MEGMETLSCFGNEKEEYPPHNFEEGARRRRTARRATVFPSCQAAGEPTKLSGTGHQINDRAKSQKESGEKAPNDHPPITRAHVVKGGQQDPSGEIEKLCENDGTEARGGGGGVGKKR